MQISLKPHFCPVNSDPTAVLTGSLFVSRELSLKSLFFCLVLNVAQMHASNCAVMDRWLMQRFAAHAKWLPAQ